MVVPFAAGGPTDTIGRVVAEGMRVGPMCEGRHVASMSKFLAQINEPQRWLRALSKKCTL